MNKRSEVKSIVIEPNYDHLFAGFNREVKIQAEGLAHTRSVLELHMLREILVPLNIALQCATNREAIETLRTTLFEAVQVITEQAEAIEAAAE